MLVPTTLSVTVVIYLSLYTISQTNGFVLLGKNVCKSIIYKNKNLVPGNDYPNLFSFSES